MNPAARRRCASKTWPIRLPGRASCWCGSPLSRSTSRRAHHRGQISVQAAPPVRAGQRAGGRGGRRGGRRSTHRPGDRIAAVTGHGGLAELAVVPAWKAVAIPADITAAQAAVLGMVYGTVLHGLTDRARLEPGETLLVLGAAGGIGLAAVELGKLMGARVVVEFLAGEGAGRARGGRRRGHRLSARASTPPLARALRAVQGGRARRLRRDLRSGRR